MREEFLHYVWRLGRFDLRDLRTTTGMQLRIQNFGTYNARDGGPDFQGARLRIGDLQWAGNVEMHLNAGDWYAHGHDSDPAYDNVILHVVLNDDRPVFRRNGEPIECLELADRIPPGLVRSYFRLLHNENWVACQNQLSGVPTAIRSLWLDRLLIERLEARGARMLEKLESCGNDWEEVFFRALARALGGRVNGEAMEVLASTLPLRILRKHKHSLLQLEALLFGQSGLIPESDDPERPDPYPSLLRREYCLLRQKYELRPLPATLWRFLRLRPNNFPTVRIAQLACLIFRSGQLFGKSLAAADTGELRNMFEVKLSNYWRNHYRFGAESRPGDRKLGRTAVNGILINAVVPMYVAYSVRREDVRYRERALDILRGLPAERNHILSRWQRLGWRAEDAGRGQALMQLRKEYCEPVRCLECAVGCHLLNRTNDYLPDPEKSDSGKIEEQQGDPPDGAVRQGESQAPG